MPVAAMHGGEGPAHAGVCQTVEHVGIVGNVNGVVEVDEPGVAHRPIGRQARDQQAG